eukprot:TRINITY_DN2636_c0_g2_i1.p1 TRINITY_DN2636_c0_g2~~TRINITY_DN2636_c0_g2_i1.p1  ORF type:complete len:864 (-),score=218.39 TRINITY_DN2636_c0_g2_i1:99-2690(-)
METIETIQLGDGRRTRRDRSKNKVGDVCMSSMSTSTSLGVEDRCGGGACSRHTTDSSLPRPASPESENAHTHPTALPFSFSSTKRKMVGSWVIYIYVGLVIIPLAVAGSVVVAAGFTSTAMSKNENVDYMRNLADDSLIEEAARAADVLEGKLQPLASLVEMLVQETALAFATPRVPPAEELAAYGYDASGNNPPKSWYGALYNYGGGDMALMLKQAGVTLTPEEIEFWVWRSGGLDSIYQHSVDSFAGAIDAWILTSNNGMRIAPYLDLVHTWPYNLSVVDYDIYTTSLKDNPKHQVKWTSLYNDLAGQGWMTSAVAPCYMAHNTSFLLGVVGVDLSVVNLQTFILDLEIGWSGYPVLLSSDGTVMSLPAAGEKEWGLVMDDDNQVVFANNGTYDADDYFNVNKREDTVKLSQALMESKNGCEYMNLFGEKKVVAWQTIESTGMQVVLLVEEKELLANSRKVERIMTSGMVVVAVAVGLLVATMMGVAIAFTTLMRRNISVPLSQLMQMMDSIGKGNYYHDTPYYPLYELQSTADVVSRVGRQLGQNVEFLHILNRGYQRFLPKAFLETLGKRDVTKVELGNCKEQILSIMFGDIRNFAAISMAMTPQELFQALNYYLSQVGPVISKHGGFIDKYLGDGFLAIFRDSANAIAAAKDIQQCITRLNQEGFMQGQLRVGVGVHTGPVLLGTVGFEDRMDVTVIADVVNIASRLEDMTKLFKCKVLATEEALKTSIHLDNTSHSEFSFSDVVSSAGHVEYRFVGHICPKGVSTPVRVYSVAAEPGEFAEIEPFIAPLQNMIRAFERGELPETLQLCGQLDKQIPNDSLVQVYADRARVYQQNGLPPFWDGSSPLPLVFDQKFTNS